MVIDENTLDRLLTGKSTVVKNFALRRLKFLLHRCSRGVREGRISIESVNRLSTFCLEIIPLIENAGIVMPTAVEFSILLDWYLDMQTRSPQEPAIVITTVCPDYPFDWMENKAVFKSGIVGKKIGIVGESILKTAPQLLHILSGSLNITVNWIVGYAGFEAKSANLESMNIPAEEFRYRLESSAIELQQKLGVPVGILPDAAGCTMEQFNGIREGFKAGDFNIRRKGMDALSDAVDARDWAGIFTIANGLNAIIIDGASVYMGRKAYDKARQILKPANHTPRFFCVCNYMGFGS
ncbi:MAG: hypothetical protein GY950_22025 [bacterium]|nr:hypothetical protein [bacterium]